MTPYLRVVAHGGVASVEAWNQHLVEFHRAFPDATSLPLSLMHAKGDTSPYEYASDRIHAARPDARSVLDVGCGDGRLLRALDECYAKTLGLYGIDLSESEIARAQVLVPRAHLQSGDVRDACFQPGSFDLVCGHLSFSLFPRVRNVFARVHGWLVPGGTLVLVLEDPLTESAFFRTISAAMQPVRKRFPAFAPLVPEYDCCEDDAVLTALLRDGGFSVPPRIERFSLSAKLAPAQLWEIVRRTYPFGLLPADLQVEAKEAMSDSLGDLSSDGRTEISLPLRFVTATA